MKIEFELAKYDESLDKFDLDENVYQIEISDEDAQTYELLKSSDLNLYNWFKEADFFLKYLKEEIYTEIDNKKVAICDINNVSFRRFFFFKVTSADSHYEYFKKLFNIFVESEWQDREEVGEEILEHLKTKRLEFVIDLTEEEVIENVSEEEQVVKYDKEV